MQDDSLETPAYLRACATLLRTVVDAHREFFGASPAVPFADAGTNGNHLSLQRRLTAPVIATVPGMAGQNGAAGACACMRVCVCDHVPRVTVRRSTMALTAADVRGV
jgi:hypothetical protein